MLVDLTEFDFAKESENVNWDDPYGTLKILGSYKEGEVYKLSWIYMIWSPQLNGRKIGRWTGLLKDLKKRYGTYYGSNLSVLAFQCKESIKVENELSKKLSKYKIVNELYEASSEGDYLSICSKSVDCYDFALLSLDAVKEMRLEGKVLDSDVVLKGDMEDDLRSGKLRYSQGNYVSLGVLAGRYGNFTPRKFDKETFRRLVRVDCVVTSEKLCYFCKRKPSAFPKCCSKYLNAKRSGGLVVMNLKLDDSEYVSV